LGDLAASKFRAFHFVSLQTPLKLQGVTEINNFMPVEYKRDMRDFDTAVAYRKGIYFVFNSV